MLAADSAFRALPDHGGVLSQPVGDGLEKPDPEPCGCPAAEPLFNARLGLAIAPR